MIAFELNLNKKRISDNQTIIKVLKLIRGTDVLVYAEKISSCLIFILGWGVFFFISFLVSLLGDHKQFPLKFGVRERFSTDATVQGRQQRFVCKEGCFKTVIKTSAVIFSLL